MLVGCSSRAPARCCSAATIAAAPEAAKALLGYVPDQPFLYDKLTAKEFLRFICDLHRLERDDMADRSVDLLEEFGLLDRSEELIETFSHGMKQRLALAGALIHRPRILILDEPMVGLDPEGARELRRLIRRLAASGHDLPLDAQPARRRGALRPDRHPRPRPSDRRGDAFRAAPPGERAPELASNEGPSSPSSSRSPAPRTAGRERHQRRPPGTLTTLLAPRVLATRNALRRRPLRAWVLAALTACFWVGSFLLFAHTLRFFQTITALGPVLTQRLLVVLFVSFFASLLIRTVVTALTTYYLSADVRFLMVAPVPRRRLRQARCVETLVGSSWMVLLFGLPVFLAYGSVYGAGPLYYVATLATMIPFLAIPAALGVMLTTVLVLVFRPAACATCWSWRASR
jgi:hypothetical protein